MKIQYIFLLLILLSTSFALSVTQVNDKHALEINQGQNGFTSLKDFDVINAIKEDIIQTKNNSTKIIVDKRDEFETTFEEHPNEDKIKISHWVTSKPDNLTYTFNYTGKVFWGDWIDYNSLENSSWDFTNGVYENNESLDTSLLFDNYNAFDFFDLQNTTAHFSKIQIRPNQISVVFSVDDSPSYPYLLDPSFGSGTIQQCQSNGFDYCNVSISSTITATDFVLNNRGTRINSGVTVTVSRSRLTINSSEYFVSLSANPFSGAGSSASSPSAGSGSSGGSVMIDASPPDGLNGASNGNSGSGGNFGCAVGVAGSGSGLAPFDFASGAAGAVNVGARSAGGGGFYGTGAVYVRGVVCATALSGGSGHSIRIIAANINLSGTTNNGAGNGQVGTGGAAGGSGAGELTLYGAYIRFNGTYSATGSNALVDGSCTLCTAGGGGGGNFRTCSKVNYNSTGSTVTLGGGAGAGGGAAGAAGTSSLNSLGSCFPNLIVNPYTDTNTAFGNLTPTLQFNMGLFNNTANVTCWMNTNVSTTTLGQYNFSTSVNTYSVPTSFADSGSYLVNFTCGNSSASIANTTSSSIVISVVDPFQITSCRSLATNGTYYMNNSVTNTIFGGTCLTLNSSNININCNGNSIIGTGDGIGFSGLNQNNISFNNCSIYNFTQDIVLSNNTNIFVNQTNLSVLNLSSTSIILSNVSFIPQNGQLINVSTINMTDGQSGSYSIAWTKVNYSLPSTFYNYQEIGNRSISITPYSGGVSLDTVSFFYTAADVASLNESFNSLWQHDNAGWVQLAATLDTSDNSLSITNLVPASDYVLLSASGPGLALLNPLNGQVVNPGTVTFAYQVNTNISVDCNLTLDAAVIDNRTFSANGTALISYPVINGEHSWSVFCADPLSTNFNSTVSRTFIASLVNYTGNVTLLGNGELAVNPQRMYYDTNLSLNVLFFTNLNNLYVQRIISNQVNQSLNLSLAPTNDFFLVVRENHSTAILTYNETSEMYLNQTNTLTLSSQASAINATSNSYFDPSTYAYTRHISSINFVPTSYYLYMVPTSTTTYVMQKNSSQLYGTSINTTSHNRLVVWQTLADYTNLTRWYFANPTACNATTDRISLYSFNGTTQQLLISPDNNCYNQSTIEGSKVIFERYNNTGYMLIANVTNLTTIYQIEGNKSINMSYNVTNPSHFLFNDNETFVFFSNESGVNFAYSCYFGGAAGNCTRMNAMQYGASVPYERGAMVTATRNGTSDIVSKGSIFNEGSSVILRYLSNVYDIKFVCFDEQQEYRKTFTVRIFGNNSATVLQTPIWGYVLPSGILENGSKRAYAFCTNGTNRLYVLGLNNNFALDFYSLNSTLGLYYTFTVTNQYGTPIQGALVTAYRFMPIRGSFRIIEQGITDTTGITTLFLEPYNLYRMTASASGYQDVNFELNPTPLVTNIAIRMTLGNQSASLPNQNQIFNDTTYTLTPTPAYYTENQNVSFQLNSHSSTLTSFTMTIFKQNLSGQTVVYNTTVTGQPTGGILNYTTTQAGSYLVYACFNTQSLGYYCANPRAFTVGNNTGFVRARNDFASDPPISGFGYFFLALLAAMCAGGFVSKYTYSGAGAVTVLILWFFAYLNPNAVLFSIGSFNMVIWTATVFVTVITVPAIYLVSRVD